VGAGVTRRLALDIAERAAMTALQAFLAVLLANAAGMTDMATVRAAGLAALAAALSVVKSALASHIGDDTAALLPARDG
jgi:hypothetical protein